MLAPKLLMARGMNNASIKLVSFGFVGLFALVACSSERPATESSQSSVTKADETEPLACQADPDFAVCALCCAGNGPAKQIFEATIRCFAGCTKGDKKCEDACWTEYDTACKAAGDACPVAEKCIETSCFEERPTR